MEEVVFALDLKERILKRRGGHFSNQEFHEITNLNKTKAHILEKEWGGALSGILQKVLSTGNSDRVDVKNEGWQNEKILNVE